jgi:hypothetical protein
MLTLSYKLKGTCNWNQAQNVQYEKRMQLSCIIAKTLNIMV